MHPELALPGAFAVGLRRIDFDAGKVIDIGPTSSGSIARRLSAMVRYPAAAGAAPQPLTQPTTKSITQELQSHPWRRWPTRRCASARRRYLRLGRLVDLS